MDIMRVFFRVEKRQHRRRRRTTGRYELTFSDSFHVSLVATGQKKMSFELVFRY